MAAVAQRSLPLQTGTAQICARPDPFQQALIVCPPGFQGKAEQTRPLTCSFLFHLQGTGAHAFLSRPPPWTKAEAKALFISERALALLNVRAPLLLWPA